MNYIYFKATATGWGFTNWRTKELPDELQEVNVKVLSNQKCRDMINKQPKPFEITNDMLCTADENLTGGEGICQGDSGGKFLHFNFHYARKISLPPLL